MPHFVYVERGETKVQIMACPLKHSMLRFRRYMCIYVLVLWIFISYTFARVRLMLLLHRLDFENTGVKH